MEEEPLDSEEPESEGPKRPHSKRTTDKLGEEEAEDSSEESCEIYDDNFIIDKLPTDRAKLTQLLSQVKTKIKEYKQLFLEESTAVGKSSPTQPPNPTWVKMRFPSALTSLASTSSS